MQRNLAPIFSLSMIALCFLAFSLSFYNVLSVITGCGLAGWIIGNPGIYWLAIVGSATYAEICGISLENSGRNQVAASTGNADRDRHTIMKFGGRAISLGGLGLMLAALLISQKYLSKPVAGSPSEGGIGFYDLMTWLGTFATFGVVVATALVAMWLKRRDDETQHSASVMAMRQAWIDKVRRTLSLLISNGQALRATPSAKVSDMSLVGEVRGMFREIELQLNPTEGHHAVLIEALRSWLGHAGLEEHFRNPLAQLSDNHSDFDITTGWIIMLGQLVLKIEWVVTSLDRKQVEFKVEKLWKDIEKYEADNGPQLSRIANKALDIRRSDAYTLLKGANIEPSGRI